MKKLFDAIRYYILYFKYYGKYTLLHKPLCEKYRNESLLLFNRFYVCRSCTYLYIGAFVGFLYALSFRHDVFSPAYFIFAASTIMLSKPSTYRYFSRRFRDILRFCDGSVAAIAITGTFIINVWLGISVLTVLYGIKMIFNRERDSSKICCGCAELQGNKSCSGYREQTKALLDLEKDFCKTLQPRKEIFR